MKKLYFLFTLFLSLFSLAQVPQGFSYQAIAFNSAGQPVVNGNISVRISIIDNTATGAVLYTETHNKTTNSKGLVNLNIGQGVSSAGSFSAINWALNPKFIKVEIDPNGGSNYVSVGVNQLMSVPFAMVAGKTASGDGIWAKNSNNRLAYNDGDIEVGQNGSAIWLTSASGKKFKLSVDEGGKLSLPIDSAKINIPNQLYLYGSFNNWDVNSALEMRLKLGDNINDKSFLGYKYFTSGTKLKFLSAKDSSSSYGFNGNNLVFNGGSEYTIPANGFYEVSAITDSKTAFMIKVESVAPSKTYSSSSANSAFSYNPSTNKFTSVSSDNEPYEFNIYIGENYLGKSNLNDGSLVDYGQPISINPGSNTMDVTVNFNGTGSYTVTNSYTGITSAKILISGDNFGTFTTVDMVKDSNGIFSINYPIGSKKILIASYNGTTLKYYAGITQGSSTSGKLFATSDFSYALYPFYPSTFLKINFNDLTYSFN